MTPDLRSNRQRARDENKELRQAFRAMDAAAGRPSKADEIRAEVRDWAKIIAVLIVLGLVVTWIGWFLHG